MLTAGDRIPGLDLHRSAGQVTSRLIWIKHVPLRLVRLINSEARRADMVETVMKRLKNLPAMLVEMLALYAQGK